MPSPRKGPPRGTRETPGDPREAPPRFDEQRSCETCGTVLSAYNAGPHCWRHSVGMPWRGPSAKPKID